MGQKNPTQVVLQKMGEQADGKIHFLAGKDSHEFNLEDGDEFVTATLAVDPWEALDGS